MISLLMNILWVVLFGFTGALAWFMAAILMVISIVGIPWARAAFNMGLFVLWPFGQMAVDRRVLTGREDIGTSPLGFLGNVVWFVFAGWWLALYHILAGVVWFVTIIGIPFAIQHFKFAVLALAPIGKAIVPVETMGMPRY
ncbi:MULTISPECIES: YccF domain-containing protein [Nitrospirillum]|uniref:Inner membrane protein YccF n=1 Tax=Nitrospirillum amazonense TaxID=28077 RepID=A0A560GVW6_9PROT|nr:MULTISPECIES: YccF domain-containing protein [Nitrospirillum]MDZ5647039.1 YccF domain-containing protein [Nitrospirillum sp. BR 11828]TWB38162.1 uncharacterized membrane protein YccF (DUF307 family) [Nitrospirillum amazonense]